MMHLQAPCMPRALPLMAAGPFCRGAHAVGRQACLARPLLSSSACSRIYRTRLQVTAVASAEPSTVKIITQGRHVEVTDSLKSYVVGLQLRPPFNGIDPCSTTQDHCACTWMPLQQVLGFQDCLHCAESASTLKQSFKLRHAQRYQRCTLEPSICMGCRSSSAPTKARP